MKLGPNLSMYRDLIFENVFKYAYENSIPKPMLTTTRGEWIGTIFNVSEMETHLHWDVRDDLETLGMMQEIKKHCDKYVILPDVFSNHPIPMSWERNQYDTDRRNIVILNNRVFELYDVGKKTIKYNHNGKLYYFYNSREIGDLFDGIIEGPNKNYIEAMYIKEYGWASDRVTPDWIEKYKDPALLKLWINKRNLASEDPDDPVLRDKGSTQRPPLAGIVFAYPYLEFDYKYLTDAEFPEIPGLKSLGWRDMGMRPKWFNMLYGKFNVYDPDSIMTTTALVLMKDGTYHVENLWSNPVGKYVERIGKHNIELKKDDNIKKVYMFIKPQYKKDGWVKPDTTYYAALNKNSRSGKYMRKHACRTDKLYEFMLGNTCMCVDKLIEYGYEYDLDVLKVIQNSFPHIVNLDRSAINVDKYYGYKKDYKNTVSKYIPRLNILQTLKTELNNFKSVTDYLNDNSVTVTVIELKKIVDEYIKLSHIESDIYPTRRLRDKFNLLKEIIHPHMYNDKELIKSKLDYIEQILSNDIFEQVVNGTLDKIPDKYNDVYDVVKCMFKIWNPLQKYPALFFNNRLYNQDYKIIKEYDADVLLLDPKHLMQFFYTDEQIKTKVDTYKAKYDIPNGTDLNPDGTIKPYIPIKDRKKDPWLDPIWLDNEIKEIFKRHKAKIIFTDYPYNQIEKDGEIKISKQSGKITRDLYKNTKYCLDVYSDYNWKSLLKGVNFVNGYRSFDKPTDWGMSYSLPLYDGYKLGPWYPVWNFANNLPYTGNTRIWMGDKVYLHQAQDISGNEQIEIKPISEKLPRDNRFIAFDKMGAEVTNKLEILSRDYINMNYMSNIEGYDLKPRACTSIYFPRLDDFMYGYDLNIDESRIHNDNVGFANDRIMQDKETRSLFDPDSEWEVSLPVVTNKIIHNHKFVLNREISAQNAVTNHIASKGNYIDDYSYCNPILSLEGIPNKYTIKLDTNVDIGNDVDFMNGVNSDKLHTTLTEDTYEERF